MLLTAEPGITSIAEVEDQDARSAVGCQGLLIVCVGRLPARLEKSMTGREIADRAISILNKRITNEVFMIIQNDSSLMHDYLRAVEEHGLDTINKSIGQEVKATYGLTNDQKRENNPACTLIQSHQKFE